MSRPRLLDLFCGAGGAAMGYYRAGFDVVGVDIAPQKNYPFAFVRADALEFVAAHGHEFDVIHASPPCQAYSCMTPMDRRAGHPDLIDATRDAVAATGRPWVIENVAGARRKLRSPIMLCGTMFGLNIWRHRYFECWPTIHALTPPCQHVGAPVLVSGTTRRGGRVQPIEYSKATCAAAIGIDWMIRTELDNAIPPAFSEWIGRQLVAVAGSAAIP